MPVCDFLFYQTVIFLLGNGVVESVNIFDVFPVEDAVFWGVMF